jgi:ABC-2 type transport system ATP-binding protein
MNSDAAIHIDSLWKRYRLYHEYHQTLKGTIVRGRGRRAKYEEFWALKDVSFDVAHGETFAIIGENGSGKSTLLKCLARILAPDRGQLVARGRVSALLELGTGFHPELTGRENVYLNASLLGLTKKEVKERFGAIVDFSGIERFLDTPVKYYSSGMYIRLGFSIAIHVQPDILLIDEILAVGDADFQRKCFERIDELRERGATIVIVTHALGSIKNLCDRAALLDHGELTRLGPAAEVIDNYLGDVIAQRVPDGEHGQRWGSGEAKITAVEILDAAGQPAKRIRTGDPVVFRAHWRAEETVERPVFGFSIQHLDGVDITGPNTRESGNVPDKIRGSGYTDLHVDRLLLLPGTYDLTAAVFNYSLAHVYDLRHRTFRFDVERGNPDEGFGMVSLGGYWDGPTQKER